MFRPGFTCLAVLWILRSCYRFHLRDSHTLRWTFPCPSVNLHSPKSSPYPAGISTRGLASSAFARHVWPLPRSLATTYGISVDVSSSPYLDVSVQAVPSVCLFDSAYGTGVLLRWVSPFRDPWINGCLLLPKAYRSLPRLSSAPSAKAFALRPF